MVRRSTARWWLTLVGGGFALGLLVVGVVLAFFDIKVERAGNGRRTMVSLVVQQNHSAALEEDRGRQRTNRSVPPTPLETMGGGGVANSALEVAHSGWTDFRGPNRDGQYGQPIRSEWPAGGLEPLWRQPVGGGFASFVVVDGRAITIEQRRQQEVVVAYDPSNGRELWTHGWSASFAEAWGSAGPRATPTWYEGKVYALGATGQLWCLEAATGSVIWSRDILRDSRAHNLQWAMAASPLVVGDLVITQPGGQDGWSVVAYHRETGDVVWHALDDARSYTSPMLVRLAGVEQVLVVTETRVAGLSLEHGELMWDHPWVVSTVPNIAQPVVIGDDRLFLSAGYGHGATLLAFDRQGDRISADVVWRNARMKNKFSSSVYRDGYLYGLDESILACVDAMTGELMWKGGRYGHGQLLLAGEQLVVLTERGDIAIVRATPSGHDQLTRFDAISGKTWSVPALADGLLLVRNEHEMAGYDLTAH